MSIDFVRRTGNAGYLPIVFCILAASGSALAVEDKASTELEDIIVYAAADRAPWQLFMGTPANWTVWVNGKETQSAGADRLTVNKVEDESGRSTVMASWMAGTGILYWQSEQRIDLVEYEKQGGALSLVTRIDQKPAGTVTLKMGCGYPCEGSLSVEKLFSQVPEGQWFRASFELECFKDSGAWMDRIIAPLQVAADSEFGISISDARITANPAPESLIRCD